MRIRQGYWVVVLVALGLLLVLTPSYISLARASDEVQQLRKQVLQMTSTITITWPDGSSTVYHSCTAYVKSDNGTVSFTGKRTSRISAARRRKRCRARRT